jgi:hypothetical protein
VNCASWIAWHLVAGERRDREAEGEIDGDEESEGQDQEADRASDQRLKTAIETAGISLT